MEHKLITVDMLEAEDASFSDIANLGDWVDEEIVDNYRACLPPACDGYGMTQMGEPIKTVFDTGTGKYRAVFLTFIKNGGRWQYAGLCFQGEITHWEKATA